MKLQALGVRVLVKMDDRESQIGNIFIPDAYTQKEVTGTVESIGIYVENVNIGDKVLIRQNAGLDIIIDEGEYTIVNEDDILCRIKDSIDELLESELDF